MSQPLKQFVVICRRAGQTIQQFFDHHYQIHGKLTHDMPNPELLPLAYYQTHFFDSLYANSTPAQPEWSGHNDAVELYFRDMQHLSECYGSEYVRNVVGPDGHNFNDFAATVPIFAYEEALFDHESVLQASRDEQRLSATWWVQKRESTMDHEQLGQRLNPLVTRRLKGMCIAAVANVALPDDSGMLRYFTGEKAPSYAAAYEFYLQDKSIIPKLLKELRRLEASAADLVIAETSFVVFGIRSVVLDQDKGLAFDSARQPKVS